jgi:beta-phosphoglucomutase family hydrolase
MLSHRDVFHACVTLFDTTRPRAPLCLFALGSLLGVFASTIPFHGVSACNRARRLAHMNEAGRLNFEDFDAILCDLDGVITRTADLHAAAWKRLFDDYLKQVANQAGSQFKPFDLDDDYRLHLDGKPRHEGVRDFLKSRGLALPLGSPSDNANDETLYGLGNKKDTHFEAALHETGVVVYPATVQYLRLARAAGLKTAVVSSSHHCGEIIDAIGLAALFDTRVDGHDIDRLQLRGKPAPDTFQEAARRLAVQPKRAIVIEDALAGVQAGRAGGFGLVIGVDRRNQAQALKEEGAHVVVADLAELLPPVQQTELSSLPPQ